MSYRPSNRRPSYGRARYPRANSSNRRGPSKENIHPSRFVKAASMVAAEIYAPTHAFSELNINRLLKANLESNDIRVPSPIQDQTIPQALAGRDIVGIADTGTGKTLAFAVPVLQKLLSRQAAKALILAPTRELAQQINEQFRRTAAGSGLRSVVLIGGAPMYPQLRDLKAGAHIVIGTPGRIKDHLERKSLNLSTFDVVVLDEVDRMLDMGFVPDVRRILGQLKLQRQSFFFSATLDKRVGDLIREFSRDPLTVSIKTGDTVDSVEQNIVSYNTHRDKIEKLHDLLISGQGFKALVFDDTQRGVQRLSDELQSRGFKVDAIHGGKSQGQRQRALRRFKTNEISVLVATDVAARGIDVPDITHVINYSTPSSYNDYVHRIGRTGRAGQQGQALTFIAA